LLCELLESELHGEISDHDTGYSSSKNASNNDSQHVLDAHGLPPQGFCSDYASEVLFSASDAAIHSCSGASCPHPITRGGLAFKIGVVCPSGHRVVEQLQGFLSAAPQRNKGKPYRMFLSYNLASDRGVASLFLASQRGHSLDIDSATPFNTWMII